MPLFDRKILLPALLTALAVGGLVVGWRLFWFLTDDAYIAFRYISNSMLGYGYVWNPPPFQPVEGYTSFLWVVLLDGIWRLTGVQPPQAANHLSLFFALQTLLLAAFMAWRMVEKGPLQRVGPAVFALFLLGLVSSRPFLTWSSSGLETALFNFLILAWLFFACTPPADRRWWLLGLSGSAAQLALTRPDGLLYCAATGVMLALWWRSRRGELGWRPLLWTLPLLAVPVHLVWRRLFYGAWLPNTYYAKTAMAWPESGVRYLASFVLEHALWIWLAVVMAALLVAARRVRAAVDEGRPVVNHRRIVRTLAVATVLAHVAYYTLVVGGDHFEYRVYSHLAAPIMLTLVWGLVRLDLRPALAVGALALFLACSSFIPWTHWGLTRHLDTREQTHQLRVAVAPNVPGPLRWYVRPFDDLQDWLIGHYVGNRHQEHKVAHHVWMTQVVPPRSEGQHIHGRGYPVMAFWGGIGGLAWSLPHINFIDLFGLSDPVIARSEAVDKDARRMAHDRIAPAPYVDSFKPNVNLVPGRGIEIAPRSDRLTAREIIEIQERWAEKVGHGQ